MKTLGELRVGDPMYLIDWDGGFIDDVNQYTVGVIVEIAIGEVIKYIDESGSLRAFTLEKEKYDMFETPAYYCGSVCSDREFLMGLLNKDKAKFEKRHNNILNKVDKKNES